MCCIGDCGIDATGTSTAAHRSKPCTTASSVAIEIASAVGSVPLPKYSINDRPRLLDCRDDSRRLHGEQSERSSRDIDADCWRAISAIPFSPGRQAR